MLQRLIPILPPRSIPVKDKTFGEWETKRQFTVVVASASAFGGAESERREQGGISGRREMDSQVYLVDEDDTTVKLPLLEEKLTSFERYSNTFIFGMKNTQQLKFVIELKYHNEQRVYASQTRWSSLDTSRSLRKAGIGPSFQPIGRRSDKAEDLGESHFLLQLVAVSLNASSNRARSVSDDDELSHETGRREKSCWFWCGGDVRGCRRTTHMTCRLRGKQDFTASRQWRRGADVARVGVGGIKRP
ncbi:hypothetical protein R3P38DRAFT_3518270 [Favolaschia claudopus]|uniref:Uncharacterized protein n=1 Tax=Favolaschia claudopus TaxID=2862362 RepID=A0AAW0BP43_9AGAR